MRETVKPPYKRASADEARRLLPLVREADLREEQARHAAQLDINAQFERLRGATRQPRARDLAAAYHAVWRRYDLPIRAAVYAASPDGSPLKESALRRALAQREPVAPEELDRLVLDFGDEYLQHHCDLPFLAPHKKLQPVDFQFLEPELVEVVVPGRCWFLRRSYKSGYVTLDGDLVRHLPTFDYGEELETTHDGHCMYIERDPA